jgi:hypothetical protein
MCLTPVTKRQFTADKDLYVLKFLQRYDNGTGYISPYQSTHYKLGKRKFVSSPFKRSFFDPKGTVSTGIHAYVASNLKPESAHFPSMNMATVICLAKIPKGSKYMLGEAGDIVTNQLVLVDELLAGDDSLEEIIELPMLTFFSTHKIYNLNRDFSWLNYLIMVCLEEETPLM